MKRVISFMLVALLVCPAAFASVGVKDNGTMVGAATDLNVKGATISLDGSDVVIDMSTGAQTATSYTATGDVTFRSTLVSIGRVNGASTLASSATALAPSSLPYVVVTKGVGGITGLDVNPGTTLSNGKPGQVLKLYMKALATSGTWLITPVTATNWSSCTLSAAGAYMVVMYVNDTIGWIVIGQSPSGCAVAVQAAYGW